LKIYTRKGDDGTTGLLFGGRVRKDDPAPEAYGAVDEAQAALGVARAETGEGSELDVLLVRLERDLWVVMAELATAPENRTKLDPGVSLVTSEMVDGLEPIIDDLTSRFDAPTEFVVPGQNRLSALLDVARTAVRKAERRALVAAAGDCQVVPYLNRLSDLLWTMARWQEGQFMPARERKQ
jgi:cob(I)alamin adenosyltransferase